MPPQIFKNKVIAVAGPLPGQLNHDNLKRWTENRRGRFSETFDEDVTHLLCTRAQFRQRGECVKLALGQKDGRRVHIVHCDWFENSAVHNRKLPEAEYSMKKREAKRRAEAREKGRIARGKANGEKFVNTNYYHIYRDREFFPYQVELIQHDKETGAVSYKYTLCLWESNAKPQLYWFTAKLLDKNPGKANVPRYLRGSKHAVKWREAFDQFQGMFEKLCKISWEDRVSMQGIEMKACQYSPPVGGKPVGRRLRHSLDYCLQINAELRGLPWPPVKPEEQAVTDRHDDANEVLVEEKLDDEVEAEEPRVEVAHDDMEAEESVGDDMEVVDESSMSEVSGGVEEPSMDEASDDEVQKGDELDMELAEL